MKTAQQELIDVMMEGDFVQRRDATVKWCERWIATGIVAHPKPLGTARAMREVLGEAEVTMTKAALLDLFIQHVAKDRMDVFELTEEDDEATNTRTATLTVHVLRAKPREP